MSNVSPMRFVENDSRLLLAFGQGGFWLAENSDTALWQVDQSIIPSTLGAIFLPAIMRLPVLSLRNRLLMIHMY